MQLYTFILIIHLISAAIWMGGSLYQRIFLAGNIRKWKGTENGRNLAQIYLTSGSLFIPNILILLATGILLTTLSSNSFFSWSWLGLKQAIMLLILIGLVLFVIPILKKSKAFVQKEMTLTEEAYSQLNKLIIGFDIVLFGVLVNIVLSVWKP